MLPIFYKTGFTSSFGENSNKDLILLNNILVIFYWLKPKLKKRYMGGGIATQMSVEAVKRESWCEYRSPELSSLVSREDVFLNIKVPFLILKENDLKPPVLLRLVVNGIIASYHGNMCWDNRLTAIDWLENLELLYRGICQMYWQKTKFKVISSLGGTLFLFSVLHGPVFTWSGLRIKIFCNSQCFTRFFSISQGSGQPCIQPSGRGKPRVFDRSVPGHTLVMEVSKGGLEGLAWKRGSAESRARFCYVGFCRFKAFVKEQGIRATSL